MNKRDKILERIINLRNRAENDGSSESEAMNSLTMAAKLMDSYQVQEAELAIAESEGRVTIEVITQKADANVMNGNRRHRVIQTLWAVQNFTNTRVVIKSNGRRGVEITGDKPDVEVANYLIEVIRKALDNEYEAYKRRTVGVGRGAKAAFQQAMASRIATRLGDMKDQSDADRQRATRKSNHLSISDSKIDSSTALVMIDIAAQKKKQVDNAVKNKYSRLGTAKGFGSTSNGTAHGAGHKAGNRVNLGKAVNGSAKARIAA